MGAYISHSLSIAYPAKNDFGSEGRHVAEEWFTSIQGLTAYALIFGTLYVSGAGVPIPEEFPLAAGGYLLANGSISLIGLIVCVMLALALGDLTAYWLGRRFGYLLCDVPPFKWMLTRERLDMVRDRFRQHEGKAIFFARFFAGIRLVTFIFAGIAHVRVSKFVLLDMLAALLSAPIFVVIGYVVGDLHRAHQLSSRVSTAIGVGVAVVLGLAWLGWMIVRRRRQSAASAHPAQDTGGKSGTAASAETSDNVQAAK